MGGRMQPSRVRAWMGHSETKTSIAMASVSLCNIGLLSLPLTLANDSFLIHVHEFCNEDTPRRFGL